MDSSEQILNILQRADTFPKKQPFRPNLQPIIGSKVPRVGSGIKVKPVASTSGGVTVGSGL